MEDEEDSENIINGYTVKNGEIGDIDDTDQEIPEDSIEGGKCCNFEI